MKRILVVCTAALLALALYGCGSSSSGGSAGSGGAAAEDVTAAWAGYPQEYLKLYDSAPATEEEMPKISVQDLKAKIDNGDDMVIVDVNVASEYAKSHLPGAIGIPWALDGFGSAPSYNGVELPRGVPVYFYCDCQAEEDSAHMGYSAVSNYGYRNIMIVDGEGVGGREAWTNAGYELES